jgi:hypothetical protein
MGLTRNDRLRIRLAILRTKGGDLKPIEKEWIEHIENQLTTP